MSRDGNISGVPHEIAWYRETVGEYIHIYVPNSSVGGTTSTRDTKHNQSPAVDPFP